MRILQIRFSNLNALVGQWQVDLTHPAYPAEGIFAITGPTGSGKSTLLDAICLALYGRTPRLARINKSGNEIMSRQCGDCFAEVTFATEEGRFRCHWSQRRARRKAKGELQPPRQELSDATSGAIIEQRPKAIAARIEAVTGMDFERFTRSMLLAQGDFAKFLLAAADERAPVLEQITGTGIYSRISMRVHEQFADGRRQLETLLAEQSGILLLDDDEETRLRRQLAGQYDETQTLEKQLQEVSGQLAGRQRITALETTLRQLQTQQSALTQQLRDFAAERQRLQRAMQALTVEASAARLQQMHHQRETLQRRIQDDKTLLPAAAQHLTQCDDRLQQHQRFLTAQQETLACIRPLLQQARDIDSRLTEKRAALNAADAEIVRNSERLAQIDSEYTRARQTLYRLQRSLKKLQQQRHTQQANAALVESYSGIKEKCALLLQLLAQQAEIQQQLLQTQQQQTVLTQQWQTQQTHITQLLRQQTQLTTVLHTAQEKKRQCLRLRPAADWRARQQSLDQRLYHLQRLQELYSRHYDNQQQQDTLTAQLLQHQQQEIHLQQQISAQTALISALEQHCALLEKQLQLLQQIMRLEDLRHELVDGQPCPLCGSTDHPYADHTTPTPVADSTHRQLDDKRSALKAATAHLSSLQVAATAQHKDIEQTHSTLQRLRQNAQQDHQQMTRLLQQCALTEDQVIRLPAQIQSVENELADITGLLGAAEDIDNDLARLTPLYEQAKTDTAEAEKTALRLSHQQQRTEEENTRLTQQLRQLQAQRTGLWHALCRLLPDDEAQMPDISEAEDSETQQNAVHALLARLSARRNAWQALQNQQLEQQRQLEQQQPRLAHLHGQRTPLQQTLTRQAYTRKQLYRECSALHREYHLLVGDRNPDDSESALLKTIQKAQQRLEALQEASSDANTRLITLRHTIDQAELQLTQLTTDYQQQHHDFVCELQQAGFNDENDYRSACLPAAERQALAARQQQLDDDSRLLQQRETDTQSALAAERQQQYGTDSIEMLQQKQLALQAQQQRLQQQIGAVTQQLDNNDTARRRFHSQAERIAQQRRLCARWEMLHDLIGSADGKKYRNFAQGLTFAVLIGHANHQLQKMTDRYLLTHDPRQPLALQVLDLYQAGLMRSAQNLSGGESFIVSLALALGLAQMVSRNVRVDSLFLDEGFGTLDEDTLETALNTLCDLHHEGKLIGVISHVQAIRERLATRIQLIPQSGGRSILRGPGCRREDATGTD